MLYNVVGVAVYSAHSETLWRSGVVCRSMELEIQQLSKIMNAQMYIDVLQDNLQKSVINLGIQETQQFQQDNDPKKHQSGKGYKSGQKCLQKQHEISWNQWQIDYKL